LLSKFSPELVEYLQKEPDAKPETLAKWK